MIVASLKIKLMLFLDFLAIPKLLTLLSKQSRKNHAASTNGNVADFYCFYLDLQPLIIKNESCLFSLHDFLGACQKSSSLESCEG